MFRTITNLFILIFVFTSCNNTPKLSFTVAEHSTSIATVEKNLIKGLDEDLGIKLKQEVETDGSNGNLKVLNSGLVDLSIAQNPYFEPNDSGYNYSNIRVILPLYKQVLLIVCPREDKGKSLPDMVRGKRVGLGPRGHVDEKFFSQLFKLLGVSADSYTPVYTSFEKNLVGDSIDISFNLTGLFNNRITNMLESNSELSIYSFDSVIKINQGSILESVCMKMWTTKPVIIPKGYFSSNQQTISTLSIWGCLFGHKDLNEEVVYKLIEGIVNNKNNYIKKNPELINIDPYYSDNYFYPLHNGAIMYKDKDKPTFIERYVEVFALIFSVFVFLIGIVPTYKNFRDNVKKNRLDRYYTEVLKIEKESIDTEGDLREFVVQLNVIRREVYDLMIEEKIRADENFNIFLKLLENTLKKLE